MNRFKRGFINLKFRKKVLLICIAASCLPIITLGSMWYYQIQDALVTRENENLSEALNQSILNIDYKLNNYINIINQIVWNDEIKNGLTAEYNNNFEMYKFYKDTLAPLLTTPPTLQTDIDSITIYTDNQMNPYGQLLRPLTDIKQNSWFDSIMGSNRPNLKASSEDETFKLIYKIFDESRTFNNIVQMEINYQQLFASMPSLFEEDYGVIIFDNDNKPVYSYETFSDTNLAGQFPSSELDEDKASLETDFVLQQAELPFYGWTVYLYRPTDIISAATLPMRITVVLVIFLSIAIMAVSIYLLAKVVVRPLEKLSKNMEKIEKGDLTVSVFNSGTDEIGSLIKQFGNMVNKLKDMINQVYKSKIAQQEYEMKALQAQINPHFFYNSLSLINSKAIMAEQEDISQMAQHLSTFYRTTLNKGRSMIEVEKELENVISYINIQQLMHSNSFDVYYELDKSAYHYTMLNLLLQPLVENAIIHGIDYKESSDRGKLVIRLKKKENTLEFSVIDNGVGIDPTKLQSILTTETEGYGVRNVHNRVQLYYGSSYGLTYESEMDHYTKVTLVIPTVHEEAQQSHPADE
ncbi:sensor histidine kinase [Oceanobacillus sojae]|uniref:sensor histidine kinase n=1 Tax=Oceanobacillus sojae TaxID=582851 RepID=UPI0021A3526F|nr:sensor histidine kinase [Oceanobacillus sojae]MCT1904428.1 sensor histidine kinase [Oceanobacillus sojae]